MSERRGGAGTGRRRLLRTAGALAAVASAGCSGLVSESPAQTTEEEPETYTLTVRFEDENGEPVLEVVASVVDADGVIQRAEARAPDRRGISQFELENGDYVIETESQEYTNTETPVTIDGEDVERTITLERGFA